MLQREPPTLRRELPMFQREPPVLEREDQMLQREQQTLKREHQTSKRLKRTLERLQRTLKRLERMLERWQQTLERLKQTFEGLQQTLKHLQRTPKRFQQSFEHFAPTLENRALLPARSRERLQRILQSVERPTKCLRRSAETWSRPATACRRKENVVARRKRDSKVLGLLQKRIAGMQSIRPNLDLGAGLSVGALIKAHQALNEALAQYNKLLSDTDAALNAVQELEAAGRELAERALGGIAAAYGKDSTEYEQAGGTRRSERRRSSSSAAKVDASSAT